jgi:hypothetical protein
MTSEEDKEKLLSDYRSKKYKEPEKKEVKVGRRKGGALLGRYCRPCQREVQGSTG